MKSKPTQLFAMACLTLTLLSGILRGRVDHRWGFSESMRDAAARIQEMPKAIGPWQLVSQHGQFRQLDPSTVKMLHCSGSLVGSYQNNQTGQVVNLILIVGPAGPLAQHTPDVCYVSSNYEVAERRRQRVIVDADGQEYDFAVVGFREKFLGSSPVRVYYSWNRAGTWMAPSTPKTSFAGVPMLYKVQVSTAHFEAKSVAPDAAELFLRESLPALKAICK